MSAVDQDIRLSIFAINSINYSDSKCFPFLSQMSQNNFNPSNYYFSYTINVIHKSDLWGRAAL